MKGNVQILYSGIDVFSGICPTPFLYFDKEYIEHGSFWGSKYKFSMQGQITGSLGPTSFYDIENKKNKLTNAFLSDNLPINIIEDGASIFSSDICSIDSISFDKSSYYALLPFTITASCYDSGTFIANYGVLDPKDSWGFTEQKDGTVSLSHSISAAGFNSSGNIGISNAKKWVNMRTGISGKLDSANIANLPASCFVLDSISQKVDRFNGTYSVEEAYRGDLFTGISCDAGILRYNIDVSKNAEDGLTVVSINGSVVGKNNIGVADMGALRNRITAFDFFSVASSSAGKSTGSNALNSTPFSRSISESENSSEINFSMIYDDNPIPPGVAKCVYTVTMSDNLIKNIVDVKIDAKISCERGDLSLKWGAVTDYYKNKFNGYLLSLDQYNLAGYSKGFGPTPITESIGFDKFNASISYGASWSDRYLPYSDILTSISETVSINPSILIHTAQPSFQFDGQHNVQNIGCANRESVSISVDASARPDKTVSELKTCVYAELKRLTDIYVGSLNLFVDEKSENINEKYKKMSVTYSYSFDGEKIITL